MITVEVNGEEFKDFKSISLTRRLDVVADVFSFEGTGSSFPFEETAPIQIWVDGDLQFTGNVELITGNGSHETGKMVTAEGRSRTGDLLDSTLSGSLGTFKGSVSLASLARRVLDNIGSDIQVVDLVEPDRFDPKEDIEDPEPGEGAWEFLEAYARKRQILLSCDHNGDLLFPLRDAASVDAAVVNEHEDRNKMNNVLSYEFVYDSTGRYGVYKVISQQNAGIGNLGAEDAAEIVNQSSEAFDAYMRQAGRARQLVLVSEAMSVSGSALTRAQWEEAIRRSRGRSVSFKLDGFRNQSGELWETNTLPLVICDDSKFNGRRLLNSVTFEETEAGAQEVELEFLKKDAYKLQLTEPQKEEATGGLGNAFG